MAKLENDILGLAYCTTKEIFNHILTRCAKITIPMCNENKEFEKSVNPTNPLTMYTKKQERCQIFTMDANEPILDKAMVNTMLLHTVKICLMMNTYHEW